MAGFNSEVDNPFGLPHHVRTTNLLSKVFALLAFILAAIIYGIFGWGSTIPMILLVSAMFLSIVLLNSKGFINAGSLLFCLVPVWMTLFISILGKFTQEKQSYIIYFDSRYMLLATAVLPAVAFDFKEKGRFGAQFNHISNAHMLYRNPGANSLFIFYAIPFPS